MQAQHRMQSSAQQVGQARLGGETHPAPIPLAALPLCATGRSCWASGLFIYSQEKGQWAQWTCQTLMSMLETLGKG